MRSLIALSLLVLQATLSSAGAVGLGELEVRSQLGEPFEGELQLIVSDVEQLVDVAVREGDPSDYERTQALANDHSFVFDLSRASPVGPGRVGVPVRGDRDVQDLFLDIVIVIEMARTRQLRRYSVLIDPPSAWIEDAGAAPAPRPAIVRDTVEASARRPRAAATAVSGDQQWPVRPGETLLGISQHVRGSAGLVETADAIMALNPQAFIAGDEDRLLAGAVLRLPPGAEADAEARPESIPAEPLTPGALSGSADTASRGEADGAADRLRLSASPGVDGIVSRLGDWMNADDSLLLRNADAVRLDVAMARAETVTLRGDNARLQERIELLERRAEQMKRLLALRDAVRGGRSGTALAMDPDAAASLSLMETEAPPDFADLPPVIEDLPPVIEDLSPDVEAPAAVLENPSPEASPPIEDAASTAGIDWSPAPEPLGVEAAEPVADGASSGGSGARYYFVIGLVLLGVVSFLAKKWSSRRRRVGEGGYDWISSDVRLEPGDLKH